VRPAVWPFFAPYLLCVRIEGHGAGGTGTKEPKFGAFAPVPAEAHRRAACGPALLDTEVIFGYKLDQSLDGGALPRSLQTWTFVHNFRQSLRAWMVASCSAPGRHGLWPQR
jgi:hypothetical protein